jgi:hypothetical protein
LQKVESWDENDEDASQFIAKSMLKGKTADLAGMGDDAQLLAGAMLAFIDNPDRYDDLTPALLDALEFSYANDPQWGVSQFHSLIEYKIPGLEDFELLEVAEKTLSAAEQIIARKSSSKDHDSSQDPTNVRFRSAKNSNRVNVQSSSDLLNSQARNTSDHSARNISKDK